MQQGAVPQDLRELVFDFFHRFSRFEFALKKAGFWKRLKAGKPAEPDWDRFVAAYTAMYQLSGAAKALIVANPRRQVVGDDEQSLDFQDILFQNDASELERVVRFARTVRNNLFHGGKNDAEGWDNPKRIRELLPPTIAVLSELAEHAGISGNYEGKY